MDFLKTLMAYMAATLVVAVESTSTPSVTPVPTPAPWTPAPGPAVVETVSAVPSAEVTPVPTVSVTPVPVPTITPNVRGYHNLIMGDRGDDVRRLQERLIELGYLPEGSADGAYGAKTRNAVRLFQYYNGLTVDGIAGRATQTNLFENPDAATMPPKETPTPEPTPAPDTPVPAENPAGAAAGNAGEDMPEDTAEDVPEDMPEDTAEDMPEDTAGDMAEEAAPPAADEAGGVSGKGEEAAPAAESTEPAEPTVTPYVVAPPTEIPWGDDVTPKPEEAVPGAGTEEAAESTEPAELVENVDLDETEEPAEEPETAAYEDLAGWIILNDDWDTLQWTVQEDGTEAVRSPRMQRAGDDIRVSLDDVALCVEGWDLHDEGDSVILEAQGYTLALLKEDTGLVSTVDGMELTTDANDFSFGEGHFIRVGFLAGALDGSWEWDAAEEILTLRIPGKKIGN